MFYIEYSNECAKSRLFGIYGSKKGYFNQISNLGSTNFIQNHIDTIRGLRHQREYKNEIRKIFVNYLETYSLNGTKIYSKSSFDLPGSFLVLRLNFSTA